MLQENLGEQLTKSICLFALIFKFCLPDIGRSITAAVSSPLTNFMYSYTLEYIDEVFAMFIHKRPAEASEAIIAHNKTLLQTLDAILRNSITDKVAPNLQPHIKAIITKVIAIRGENQAYSQAIDKLMLRISEERQKTLLLFPETKELLCEYWVDLFLRDVRLCDNPFLVAMFQELTNQDFPFFLGLLRNHKFYSLAVEERLLALSSKIGNSKSPETSEAAKINFLAKVSLPFLLENSFFSAEDRNGYLTKALDCHSDSPAVAAFLVDGLVQASQTLENGQDLAYLATVRVCLSDEALEKLGLTAKHPALFAKKEPAAEEPPQPVEQAVEAPREEPKPIELVLSPVELPADPQEAAPLIFESPAQEIIQENPEPSTPPEAEASNPAEPLIEEQPQAALQSLPAEQPEPQPAPQSDQDQFFFN